MSLGTNPENFPVVFLLMLGVLPAFFLVIWIGRTLLRLLRIQNSFASLALFVLVLIGPLLGASLYLDTVGTVVQARVQSRAERIRYHEEGDWSHEFSVSVQYTLPAELPAFATLSTNAAIFDEIHEGQIVAVRAVDVNHWFSFMRLANQSTLTWIRWDWLGSGLAVVIAGWLLWQVSNRTQWGCVLTLAIVFMLGALPVFFKLRAWQRSQDLSLTPLHAPGVVQEVKRVTWLDPFPSRNTGSGSKWETGFNVPQPYDIVVVRYTPQGHELPVLGVDVVDAGSPVVKPETRVEIAYAADDARTVRLLQANRSHFWKNPLGWFREQLLALALVGVILGGFAWLGNFAKRWFKTRVNERLQRRMP
ncbi:MAG: hypothetical protein U0350_21105 [Caldilineaceae bacterium]